MSVRSYYAKYRKDAENIDRLLFSNGIDLVDINWIKTCIELELSNKSEEDKDIVEAPWNTAKMYALRNLSTHQYICSECDLELRPFIGGWYCNGCRKIVQTWAYLKDTILSF